MICYRDMTFCSAKCKNMECSRKFTQQDELDAKRFNLPVAFGDFSHRCDDYQPEEGEEK